MQTHPRSNVVVAFENRDDLRCAEQALRDAGFTDDQFGVAMRGERSTLETDRGTNTAAETIGGAAIGGVVGGLLGAAAALVMPGVGPILAAGILGTTLAGAATGAVAGGLIGALVGMGVPEEEARFYDTEFRSGRIIMTARVDNRYTEAYDILRNCGAYDIQTRPAGSVGRDERIRMYEEKYPSQRTPDTNYRGDEDLPATRDSDMDESV